MNTEKKAFTVEELAEVLGTGRTATYEAVRRGEIPSIRIGRFYRIPAWYINRLETGPDTAATPPV